jgi:excinuclease ABC subunit A
LEQLRDIGNSVIVVHDKDMIERADYVIDIGPKAGKFGGEIISMERQQKPEIKYITAQYFERRDENRSSIKRREGNGKFMKLTGQETT